MMWVVIGLGALLVLVCIALSVMAGSPKDALSMVRYAFPHMKRGSLQPGDTAPDAKLMRLDGTGAFRLREHLRGRPLVLVFGSFT
ncbi:MAG TPA: hypothetical protein VMT51_03690 [Dongiaceae bacterium]|nr:hypothetical protein [Dongiaceae bacterium]